MIDIHGAVDAQSGAVRGASDPGPAWSPLASVRLPQPEARGRASACLDGAPARVAARLAARTRASQRPSPSVAVRLDRAGFELLALCHLVLEDARSPGWIAALTDASAIEPYGALVLGALCHLAVHEGEDEDGAVMRRALADGPRTWWQLGAGAGCFQAAYALACLCAGRGDQREARHWQDQARRLAGVRDVRSAVLAAFAGFRPGHGLCADVRQALAALPTSHDPDFGRTPAIDPEVLAAALRRHRTGACCRPALP
ncbi:hypothetical protein [Streptomyces sp. BE303]|uniref:hypothetical protein n=1 Tax=Streptomyces sp. BE303 TaxID=3002528 RepID=UPI002E7A7883|nr:hypothetical protein [Streptomyces sp. BE303]MED7954671.1 hypothetical protein [Streptomyces sp. BE303]